MWFQSILGIETIGAQGMNQRTLTLFAYCFTFLLYLTASACPAKYFAKSFDCQFQVSYPTTNGTSCADFIFDRCIVRECAERANQHNQVCTGYKYTTQTNWATCTNICCDPQVVYAQTADAMNQCKAYVQSSNMILIIVLAITIPIALTAIIILVVWCVAKKSDQGSCFSNCFKKRSETYQEEDSAKNAKITIECLKIKNNGAAAQLAKKYWQKW